MVAVRDKYAQSQESNHMPSALHQITMSYSAEQDRLLLRLGTTDKKEYQLMLTRRFVRVLWAALIKVLEKQPDLKRDLVPKVKKAVMAMVHQKAVSDADFSRKHEKGYENLTPGSDPLLVVGGSVEPGNGGPTRLLLKTQTGSEIKLTLNKNLLHALCKLLIGTTMKAGWDLGLTVGDAASLAAPADKTLVH